MLVAPVGEATQQAVAAQSFKYTQVSSQAPCVFIKVVVDTLGVDAEHVLVSGGCESAYSDSAWGKAHLLPLPLASHRGGSRDHRVADRS